MVIEETPHTGGVANGVVLPGDEGLSVGMPRKVAPHLDPVVVLVHRPGLAVRIEGLPFAVLLAVRPPGDLR